MKFFTNTFLISVTAVSVILLVPIEMGVLIINLLLPLILFCAVAIILLSTLKRCVL